MTTTNPLTATHLLILIHAVRRSEGQVLPWPDGIANKGGSATRALKSLLRRNLVQEQIARPQDQEWSRDENGGRITLTVTPAGRAAVGSLETDLPSIGISGGMTLNNLTNPQRAQTGKDFNKNAEENSDKLAEANLRAGTKGAVLLALLQQEAGATLPDLMAASGWQRHSVRGFLSGTLRKKHGLVIANQKIEGVRRYKVAG